MSDGLNDCRPEIITFSYGYCPLDEESASGLNMNDADYSERAKVRAERYLTLLNKLFPDARRFDVEFRIEQFSHDFGGYYDVLADVVKDGVSEQYGLYVEEYLPSTWDDKKPDVSWEQWRKAAN